MSSKKEPNIFIFATIICVICSILLATAATMLKDRQEANKLLDKQKNILSALSLLPEGKSAPEKIRSIYFENVKNMYMNPDGGLEDSETAGSLPIYILGSKNKVQKYVIPFSAYGLWSWVYGFLAIEKDGTTVAGMSVYQHGETPGLGGECEKPWFLDQFKGKKIATNKGEFVSIGIVKGNVESKIEKSRQKHFVDGISGATITSKGLEEYLKLNLQKYEPFAKRRR